VRAGYGTGCGQGSRPSQGPVGFVELLGVEAQIEPEFFKSLPAQPHLQPTRIVLQDFGLDAPLGRKLLQFVAGIQHSSRSGSLREAGNRPELQACESSCSLHLHYSTATCGSEADAVSWDERVCPSCAAQHRVTPWIGPEQPVVGVSRRLRVCNRDEYLRGGSVERHPECADCPSIDAWRASAQLAVQNGTTVPPKPAPQQDCPVTFGNSDIFGGSYPDPPP